ncbi:MAG: glycoside hydrolase family 127 protein [Pseudothermotoga sp.]|nr:glycoside hydrolase family 127 protein [Pseudothermotoga sp.]
MNDTFLMRCEESPAALLKPVALENVRINGYLGRYLERALEITIPSQYELLESTGRIDNFRRASGKINREFQGYFFNDSDVYKWVEGCSYALIYANPEQREKLKAMLDEVTKEIADAQSPDGYLNTYFTFEREKDRWTDLANMHELYCAGHLIQAAIAHHRVTKEKTLLNVALRFADHINKTFGPDKKKGASGHPEIEMALVELFRQTKNRDYLNLARFFILERGKGYAGGKEYTIDHKPFLELNEVVGHAVRMLYLCCGATDLYLETKEESFFKTLIELYNNMITKKMYITGGVGSRYEGESFGEDYELPNRRAYAETCAAIANFMWSWRMLLATGKSVFADTMELVLYNGLLSGISIDGKHYFYVNPLEDSGKHVRQEWFKCACCPTNLARFLPSMTNYLYTVSDKGLWVHLYENSHCEATLNGEKVSIWQNTHYPFSSEVEILVKTENPVRFDLFLRIPSWAGDFEVSLNEEEADFNLENGYAKLSREWKGLNRIVLRLKMNVRLVQSHPYVRENTDKIAVFKGPILFCAEQIDNPDVDVWTFTLDPNEPLKENVEYDSTLGRTTFLTGRGFEIEKDMQLYRPYSRCTLKTERNITLVPYHLWCNRQAGKMAVWLNCT